MQARFGYGSFEAAIGTLAKAVAGRRYIAGESFSAADIYVGSMLGWTMQFNVVEKRPEFVAYWDGLKNRPAYLRILEQREKLAAQVNWPKS
jgi:glutathione S-transferase